MRPCACGRSSPELQVSPLITHRGLVAPRSRAHVRVRLHTVRDAGMLTSANLAGGTLYLASSHWQLPERRAMSSRPGPTVRARRLRYELRRLREQCGLTIDQVAERAEGTSARRRSVDGRPEIAKSVPLTCGSCSTSMRWTTRSARFSSRSPVRRDSAAGGTRTARQCRTGSSSSSAWRAVRHPSAHMQPN